MTVNDDDDENLSHYCKKHILFVVVLRKSHAGIPPLESPLSPSCRSYRLYDGADVTNSRDDDEEAADSHSSRAPPPPRLPNSNMRILHDNTSVVTTR